MVVLLLGNVVMPVARHAKATDDDHPQADRKGDRGHRLHPPLPPSEDPRGPEIEAALDRACKHTILATGAFDRRDPGETMDRQSGGTYRRTGPAVGAKIRVPTDLEDGETPQYADQCAVGAEVAAPEIPDED